VRNLLCSIRAWLAGNRPHITVNVYVSPGAEASAGRAVMDALEAYRKHDGRPLAQHFGPKA
jgi:hypothetical protein